MGLEIEFMQKQEKLKKKIEKNDEINKFYMELWSFTLNSYKLMLIFVPISYEIGMER